MNHPTLTLTQDDITDMISNTVASTLIQMGFKTSRLHAGIIYRSEMLKVIPRRDFDKAVYNGILRTYKGDYPNSKVYCRISDWQEYLSKKVNKQLP